MVKSNAKTVEAYLEELAPERREVVSGVRRVVLDSLPDGYEETMQFGMISYVVPLERYRKTYNKLPLQYAALASQKNYLSLYLNNVYGDRETERWFVQEFEASGKKLDMGKSCVHFKRVDDLPMELIGQTIARTPVDDFIAGYEVAINARKVGKKR